MRFIHLYLIGYFVLVVGAAARALAGGRSRRIVGGLVAIGSLIVVGLGIMLAVTVGKPTSRWHAENRREQAAAVASSPGRRPRPAAPGTSYGSC